MPIRETDFFYGVVLFRLTEGSVPVSVAQLSCDTRGAYLVDNKAPLFIKYTSKRLSPWSFSFTREQQEEILRAKTEYGAVFVALVCGHDGICCLSFDQLKCVLDHVHEDVEWVRVSRRRKESYSVKGADGELRGKISDIDFPRVLLQTLSGTANRSLQKSITLPLPAPTRSS